MLQYREEKQQGCGWKPAALDAKLLDRALYAFAFLNEDFSIKLLASGLGQAFALPKKLSSPHYPARTLRPPAALPVRRRWRQGEAAAHAWGGSQYASGSALCRGEGSGPQHACPSAPLLAGVE